MTDKVILITGASRGIGLAVANYLLSAQSTTKLLLLARTSGPLESLKFQYPGRVEYILGDLASPLSITSAIDLALLTWNRIDSVIINHGVLGAVKRLADVDLEEFRKTFEINYFAAVALVKEVVPHLRERGGRVVFVSSGAAVGGYATWGAYGASKAALNHLAMTLAVEEPDITSVSIRPGVVDTDMQREVRELHASTMDKKDAEKFSMMKRDGGILKPEQPGHVIAKLALDAPKDLSGKFFPWNDPALAAFQE